MKNSQKSHKFMFSAQTIANASVLWHLAVEYRLKAINNQKGFSCRVPSLFLPLFIRYSVQQSRVRVHYAFTLQFILFIGPFQ